MVDLSEALSFPFVVVCFEVTAATFRRFDEFWKKLELKTLTNVRKGYLWPLVRSLRARACHDHNYKILGAKRSESPARSLLNFKLQAAIPHPSLVITIRAMEEIPPTCFVIRPHHIQNLMVIGIVFQEFRNQKIPPQFMIHVYRLLMQEIAEVSAHQCALFVSVPSC